MTTKTLQPPDDFAKKILNNKRLEGFFIVNFPRLTMG